MRPLRTVGLASVAIALCSTALALQPGSSAWSPAVTLWGAGDSQRAVQSLHRLADASSALLQRSQLDQATRTFSQAALAELQDFDLGGFYRLLPASEGGFHELRVRGALHGDRYVVTRGEPGRPLAVAVDGTRHALFDQELSLRIKPVAAKTEGRESYLIETRLGFGAGQLRAQDVVAAALQISRIFAEADPRLEAASPSAPSERAVARVRALHPRLQREDLAPVAVVFDAYPQLFEVLGRAGQIEDLRDAASGEARHVQLAMRADPKRLAQHHPALARYFEKLGKLFKIELRWQDAARRTLLKLALDTQTLTVRSECYLKGGMLVPFRGTQLFADQPVDPTSDLLARSTMLADVRLQLLGIVLKMQGVRLDLRYAYAANEARLVTSITQPPSKIEVEGAALGFVPTGLIDAFIPGDIHGLARDFFQVATTGNGGRGIQVALALATRSDGDAVLSAAGEMEALDNRLVAMGVGMVNERMLPSDAVIADGKRLLTDMHTGFVQDLARFEAQLGLRTQGANHE